MIIGWRTQPARRCAETGHSLSLTDEGLICCLHCGVEYEPRNPLELASVAIQDFGRMVALVGLPKGRVE